MAAGKGESMFFKGAAPDRSPTLGRWTCSRVHLGGAKLTQWIKAITAMRGKCAGEEKLEARGWDGFEGNK